MDKYRLLHFPLNWKSFILCVCWNIKGLGKQFDLCGYNMITIWLGAHLVAPFLLLFVK